MPEVKNWIQNTVPKSRLIWGYGIRRLSRIGYHLLNNLMLNKLLIAGAGKTFLRLVSTFSWFLSPQFLPLAHWYLNDRACPVRKESAFTITYEALEVLRVFPPG